jgi:prolyl-tRNA synthetase
MMAAQQLTTALSAAGFRVKLDTRDIRPGAKYYWWEIRGVPLRIELGPRDLDAGKAMAVKRTGGKDSICLASAAEDMIRVLGDITHALRIRAEEHTKSRLCTVNSQDLLNTALDAGQVAVIHWCRERECGDVIEATTNASILGTDVRSQYICETNGTCIVCGKPGKATLVGRAY